MYHKTPQSSLTKRQRPNEETSIEIPRKRPFGGTVRAQGTASVGEIIFKFRILTPNGKVIELKMSELDMPIEGFIEAVKREYFHFVKRKCMEPKQKINWTYADFHFTNAEAKKIRTEVKSQDFLPNKWHFLILHDGSAEPDMYQDMWDLTPDTDLLMELPAEYTFETAVADLIDNALQAVWFNEKGERRLISVELHKSKISIFDSGQGMDGATGNIVKWGKIGASMHRSYREQAIGGKPPYLMPFFGMFGYGGTVASMFLGRRTLVSSKTKKCDKVFMLHLEKEALISSSRSENCWKTKGGIRDSFKDEKENSPHRSFTKVEILEPAISYVDTKKLQCELKDIYFPYIQFDETSGKTIRPIEFQVNGVNLTEIDGGETAITNMHSCNGPEFVLQVHFCCEETSSLQGKTQKVSSEANARLRCIYFPIIKGEESINSILKKLKASGFHIKESFEGFSRVSIRRLGRLLPDARWAWLPFMEPKLKKGEKAQSLKRCCYRVKCFVETDSGFRPTPTKTDLASHHPYTVALKNFGHKMHVNDKEVDIEISRDGKKLTFLQMEKQYTDWILEMHNHYDDEIESSQDQPTIVTFSPNIKKLGLSSDGLRFYKVIKRKGICWTSGQKLKVLKGACTGCHKKNTFVILEFIILEGLPGDTCGEARLICRPLGVPENKGCQLSVNDFELQDSISLPIDVIDNGKCIAIDDIEWEIQLDKRKQKLPSSIDLLSHEECQKLEIEGGCFTDFIAAGDAFPEKVVAVVRPKAFNYRWRDKKLDPKFIVKENFEMTLEVSFRANKTMKERAHIYSVRITPSSQKGFHGLYIFSLGSNIQGLRKAGFYSFSLSLVESRDVRFEQEVQVKALAEVGSWKIISPNQNSKCIVRVGSRFPTLKIACCDQYNNPVTLKEVHRPTIKLISDGNILAKVHHMKLATAESTMVIKDIFVQSDQLDKIKPDYVATLNICSPDGAFSVDFPCQVIPGQPVKVTVHPRKLRKLLLPGQIIGDLVLDVFDKYGNHVNEDEIIVLRADGFSFQDGGSFASEVFDYTKKVDPKGRIDLRNILKVSKGYGNNVSLSVLSKENVIGKLEFKTETRELRTLSKVFKDCEPGSQLKNILFEIVDSKGVVDESINDDHKSGKLHTLTLKSDWLEVDDFVHYGFCHGSCTVHAIALPEIEGIVTLSAAHSRYPELSVVIEVHLKKVWKDNHGTLSHENLRNSELTPKSPSSSLAAPPHSPDYNSPEMDRRNYSRQGLQGSIFPADHSICLKTPKLEHHNVQNENSERSIVLLEVSPTLDIEFLEHEEDLFNSGLKIGRHENEITILKQRQSTIQQNISDLQAFIDRDSCDVSSTFGEECLRKQIERSESAASFFCKSLSSLPCGARPSDILGVVALLGSVDTLEISRMLAQYLGEDQMLAIVCENYLAIDYFDTLFLQELGSEFAQCTSGRYLALSLEDVRPINMKRDPQNIALLHEPTVWNGNKPKGFLGYAIDMIHIEERLSDWRTKSGLSLRETLFYRLFGELQIYENKECMKISRYCIREGAISLDGGIMRGNGLVALGHCELAVPNIIFPVRNKVHDSPRCLEVVEVIATETLKLAEISSLMDEETKSYEMEKDLFQRSRDRYNLHLAQVETL